MPLIPYMEFAENGLDVAFRSTASPQRVVIDIHSEGPGMHALLPATVLGLARAASWGLVTGAEYEPTAGSVVINKKPAEANEHGPDYHWELTVAGWSPRFLRVLVENMRQTGSIHRVVTMRILGEVPLDDSPFSVRTGDVQRWLDDPDAYLEQWPEPGFAVKELPRGKGGLIRVRAQGTVTKKQFEVYEWLVGAWKNWTNPYVNIKGTQLGVASVGAESARSKREMTSQVRVFDHRRAPSTALLVNLLGYYHRAITPIESVEIALPG